MPPLQFHHEPHNCHLRLVIPASKRLDRTDQDGHGPAQGHPRRGIKGSEHGEKHAEADLDAGPHLAHHRGREGRFGNVHHRGPGRVQARHGEGQDDARAGAPVDAAQNSRLAVGEAGRELGLPFPGVGFGQQLGVGILVVAQRPGGGQALEDGSCYLVESVTFQAEEKGDPYWEFQLLCGYHDGKKFHLKDGKESITWFDGIKEINQAI